jgi:hypothetical protein
MLKVEFHCHTFASKDSLTTPAELVETCRKKSIDRVIVTDHNSIQGALQAQAIDPQRVIIGEEIMTTKGELLTAFVTEEIPAGLSPQETIARLRDQGAFISVSHPFDQYRSGHWAEDDLLEIIQYVDAIEVYNARCFNSKCNARAQEFADQHNLAGTVGSDAHAAFELGSATLLLPEFKDSATLKAVIRQSQPVVRLSPFWVHFFSRYASWRKNRAGHAS